MGAALEGLPRVEEGLRVSTPLSPSFLDQGRTDFKGLNCRPWGPRRVRSGAGAGLFLRPEANPKGGGDRPPPPLPLTSCAGRNRRRNPRTRTREAAIRARASGIKKGTTPHQDAAPRSLFSPPAAWPRRRALYHQPPGKWRKSTPAADPPFTIALSSESHVSAELPARAPGPTCPPAGRAGARPLSGRAPVPRRLSQRRERSAA